MKSDKKILNEIAMKLGKVYTAKDNPPFKVNEAPTFSLKPQPNFQDKLRTDLAQKYPDLYNNPIDDYMLPTDTGDYAQDFLNRQQNQRTQDLAQKYPDMYKPLSVVQKGNIALGKDVDYTDTAEKHGERVRAAIDSETDATANDTDNLWAGGKWWQGLNPGQKVIVGAGGLYAANKIYKYLKNRRQKKKDAEKAAAMAAQQENYQHSGIQSEKNDLNELIMLAPDAIRYLTGDKKLPPPMALTTGPPRPYLQQPPKSDIDSLKRGALAKIMGKTAAEIGKMKKTEGKINEGPSYEYRKHTTKIAKTTKQNQAAVLDLYELLRKKGLDKEASMLLDAYKKNLVTFKKTYDMIMRKLV